MRIALAAALVLCSRALFAANVGDVVAVHAEGLVFPRSTKMVHYDTAGRLVASEFKYASAVTTDARLNLYLAVDHAIEVRDRFGNFVRSFPIGFLPSTMFVDRGGNLYAADIAAPRLAKFAPDGTLARTWPLALGRRMDLAADQCTLVYVTPHFVVMRKNLCTDGDPVSLGITTNGLRVTTDGRIVTNVGMQIRVHSLDGRLLHLVDTDSFGFRLALAADGDSVWLLNSGQIARIRLRDGTVLARASGSFDSFEFAVYGEPRAAHAPDHNPEVPTLGITASLLLFAALAFLAARQIA